MAELSKHLNIQDTKGEIQSCTLYTSVEEANSMGGVLPLIVDGIKCYAGLCASNDSEATSARIQMANGTKMSIAKKGGPTPGSIEIRFKRTNISGSGKYRGKKREVQFFTVPRGVRVVKATHWMEKMWNAHPMGDKYIAVNPGMTYACTMYAKVSIASGENHDSIYFGVDITIGNCRVGGSVYSGVDFYPSFWDKHFVLSWSPAINQVTNIIGHA